MEFSQFLENKKDDSIFYIQKPDKFSFNFMTNEDYFVLHDNKLPTQTSYIYKEEEPDDDEAFVIIGTMVSFFVIVLCFASKKKIEKKLKKN